VPPVLASVSEQFQGVPGPGCISVGDEQVVVVEAGDHVAADPAPGQGLGDSRREADGLERGVHAQGDPAGDVVVGEAGPVGVLPGQDECQAFLLGNGDDRAYPGGNAAIGATVNTYSPVLSCGLIPASNARRSFSPATGVSLEVRLCPERRSAAPSNAAVRESWDL
jgi:hypothetical protein